MPGQGDVRALLHRDVHVHVEVRALAVDAGLRGHMEAVVGAGRHPGDGEVAVGSGGGSGDLTPEGLHRHPYPADPVPGGAIVRLPCDRASRGGGLLVAAVAPPHQDDGECDDGETGCK